jgi:hypothetical protein
MLPPGSGISEEVLRTLAKKMISKPERPNDKFDDQESHIPAAYTYLGQFVDHDITFNPTSFGERESHPERIVNARTPRLDLDNLYGGGPGDEPFRYDGTKLLLGDRLIPTTRNSCPFDLPRSKTNSAGTSRAIIGDPRNDENVIVSQLHGMFMRFHNSLAARHPRWSFEHVQREVRWHYQWMLVHDFLPQVIAKEVLDSV